MSEKTDVSTIVLDFNKMKSKLNDEDDIIEQDVPVGELSFKTAEDHVQAKDNSPASFENLEIDKKIFFISYKTEYFEQKNEILKLIPNTTHIYKINELNTAITKNPDAIFFMYFNDTPKAINQISAQIKEKFPRAHSVIIAKNLSSKKVKQHKESKFGANSYLNEPFKIEELIESIKELL